MVSGMSYGGESYGQLESDEEDLDLPRPKSKSILELEARRMVSSVSREFDERGRANSAAQEQRQTDEDKQPTSLPKAARSRPAVDRGRTVTFQEDAELEGEQPAQ